MDVAAQTVSMPLSTPTPIEKELAARIARREPAVFEELVEEYGARVQALARRLLGWSDGADDVAQDVFLALLNKGASYRGDAAIWTFLTAVTVRRCRSLQRRAWLYEKFVKRFAPRREHDEPAVLSSEVEGTASLVRNAIRDLPAIYREVVVLHYFEELSVAELASVLGVRRNTVEVRLTRARKLLEKSLKPFADVL